MNVAELFITLGIKGSDKTAKELKGVKGGLGEVASMSLEAKAAILAALYGFEQMMSKSSKAGSALMNFNALTGISAKTLQQWQYAAQQAGISGEDLTGSLKAVQNSMTNMLLGKGAPEGLGMVAKTVGFDPKRARDSIYVMEQLQKAAQKLPQDVGNNVLKSFGLSDSVIAGMRRNVFNASNFKKADVYSDKEISQLDKANAAWSNLGEMIEKAFGHFNAKHGEQLVKDITIVAEAVVKLVDALVTLSEKLQVFTVIGQFARGAATILDPHTYEKSGKQFLKDINNTNRTPEEIQKLLNPNAPLGRSTSFHIAPKINTPLGEKTQNNNTTITQNIVHHGDAKDTKSVQDAHRSAISNAYRQRPAQRQGT